MNGQTSVPPTTRRSLRPLLVTVIAALSLAGCGDARKMIGLDRSTPDEFAVVSHTPLTVPPDLRSLPVPQPGAPRPQEPTTTAIAETALLGKAGTKAANGTGGQSLVAKAGAIDPNIRREVDAETSSMIIADKSWLDSVLFWQKKEAPYTVVDPKKEAERLRQAQATGKSPAVGVDQPGVVPTIERKQKAPLEGLF